MHSYCIMEYFISLYNDIYYVYTVLGVQFYERQVLKVSHDET